MVVVVLVVRVVAVGVAVGIEDCAHRGFLADSWCVAAGRLLAALRQHFGRLHQLAGLVGPVFLV